MALLVKDGVVFKEFTLAILKILGELSLYSLSVPFDVVITSVNDFNHLPESKHYKNLALDVRSHDMTSIQKGVFRESLQIVLGPKFTILLENKGMANEHWHIQVKRGCLYP